MSSTQPPNGNPDATPVTPEASIKTTPKGAGTDAKWTATRIGDAQ